MLTGPIPDTFTNLDYTVFKLSNNNYLTSEVPLFVLNSRAMLVIVATNINPKMVGGIELLQIIELVARDTGLPLAAPLLRGYAKVELLTIAELNSFVITAPSQNIEFICTGRVTRVDLEKGWCYVACSECTKSCSALTPHLHVCSCCWCSPVWYDDDGGDMPGDNPIPAKIESGGSSGEAALNGGTDTNGDVSNKVANPASQVVKKARMA
uniref:Uncharacterized protein n=1 Tax=Brassica oleracea TaxID=3712 RepID=A0A3P6EMM7_BRAOL|nr:unnamed protein product [Brassica oleracea]